MPTIATFGAASLRALGFGADTASGGVAAVYVNSRSYSAGASNTLSTLGAQVGDLAVVYGAVPTSPGGAWVLLNSGDTGVYYRVLTSADVSGTITGTGDNWLLSIVRGPTQAVFRVNSSAGGSSSVTITGFAPSTGSCGLFTAARHFIPGSGGTPGLPTTPATWTSRQVNNNTAGDAGFRLADRLSPAQSYYNTEDIQWTTFFQSIPGEGSELAVYEYVRV